MKILVIGSGGREHALVWKLAQSPRVTSVYCAPGNAGIESLARCVSIPPNDLAGHKAFALAQKVDLTVVGPETPLALGIVDEFRKAKLKIFGPTRGAAQIESSKSFAKDLMLRHSIPTAAARSFDAIAPALRYLDGHSLPVVIKADGLTQGKGVVVASTRGDAYQAVTDMLEKGVFGQAGRRVVIEEFLDGEELTMMAFTDGQNVVPMIPAQDHKRVGDSDTGPNTGGMGAYAPAPLGTPALCAAVMEQILWPAVFGLSRMGHPFQGVLYAGLMVVKGKPYVLEFNARFGDPETQVVMPLLKTDLADVLEAVVEHRLDQVLVRWHDSTAVCVVLTAGGYPGPCEVGIPIAGLPESWGTGDVLVFHAGTKWREGNLVTSGGRVLGVTGLGPTLEIARRRAYQSAQSITYQGRHLRSDIAAHVLGAEFHSDAKEPDPGEGA